MTTPDPVHIRLMGHPDDVAAAAKALGILFKIEEESQNYPNRVTNPGDPRVRRYIKIKPFGRPK
jgi:hypothetical protein